MKYVKKQQLYNTTERLNDILDKINISGESSLTKLEREFLDSFAVGKQNEINDRIVEMECEELFISDDGLFTFKYDGMEFQENVIFYRGILTIPIKRRKKVIHEVFYGYIIVYNNKDITLEFTNDKKRDLVELINGYESELDVFVDDVVFKLQDMDFDE